MNTSRPDDGHPFEPISGPLSVQDLCEQLLHALTQEHPLQPFSPRYFQKGSPLFSYAHEWQVLHQQSECDPQGETALAPYQDHEALTLTQLSDFLRHPVRHFFSQRLKVYFEALEAPTPYEEPFTLDTLQRYGASESLLGVALAAPGNAEQALQLRIPGIQLVESVVVLNAAKRVGWMLNPDSTATGAVVPAAELAPTA